MAWEDVSRLLQGVATDVRVITDNSRSVERLHFDDDDPRVIVAVGGNTFSRGLTLEGLSVASSCVPLPHTTRCFRWADGSVIATAMPT